MSKWLRNPKIASTVGFLILITLIWFVGPLLGLKSIELRFAAILVVMMLWVASLLLNEYLSRHAGGLLEKLLLRQADDAVMDASADKRAEVTLLRQRLLSAIDTLKTSRIGKVRGKAALYELPWYMIIGHPAAGKSTAILQSGLSFPINDKNGVQGVGGTRNCDWFFSTEGVLLDTAGRYATQNEDRSEWISFLKLLKKYRAKAPVNGIIVTISLPELMQYKSEGFAIYARQVHERIYEIEDHFSVQVPIYLLFTKIDLLGGFNQYFEDFPEEERTRPWGATLTHDQGTGFNLVQIVSQQLELLHKGLVQISTEKQAANRGNQNRPALFAFPIEFHALKEPIARFAELLHEEDPYHSKPLIRGFYFTSALQEGVPRIGAGTRVSSRFDLSRPGFDSSQTISSYSYFLRDLFREVIFPDQHLITRQTKPAATRIRVASILTGLLLLASVSGTLTWSYVGNQNLIAASSDELQVARQLLASSTLHDQLKGLQVLQLRIEQLNRYRKNGHPWEIGLGLYRGNEVEQALRKEYFAGVRKLMLEPIRNKLEETLLALNTRQIVPVQAPRPAAKPVVDTAPAPHHKPKESGLPSIELGSYFPQAIAVPMRVTAEKTSVPALPAKEIDSLENSYNALKTYLMLADASHMEAAHLADQLPRYWRSWLEAHRGEQSYEEYNQLAERLVGFYISQIGEPDLPLITTKQDLIDRSRDVLRTSQTHMTSRERVYNELKARANTQFSPLTVSRILEGKNANALTGSAMVAGAFTRDAWEKYFRNAIEEASRGQIKSDDWVLATSRQDNLSSDGSAASNQAELESLYRDEYAREWKKFLQGISVPEFSTVDAAAQSLGLLSDPANSPLLVVLTRAARETSWDNPSEISRSLDKAKTSVLEKTEQLLATARTDNKPAAGQYGPLGIQFSWIAQIALSTNGAKAPLQTYLEILGKLRGKMTQIASADQSGTLARQLMQNTFNGSGSELAEALQYVDNTLLVGASEEARDTVRPLLVRPLIQSFSALVSPVELELNEAWKHDVMPSWGSLAGKYPFADSSNEATVADIAKFLKPEEGVLAKFVTKYLNGLVVKKGDVLTARAWAEKSVKFSPAFLPGISRLSSMGTTLLQEGDSSRFELQPIPSPGISEIIVEIDGQVMRYRNGPQIWTPISWPGSNGAALGARIQVVYFNGTSVPVSNFNGRLGWMRLLAQARIDNPQASTNQIDWTIKQGRNDSDADHVRVNFRMVSGNNPMLLSSLRKQSLPEKVTF
ncbi:MAG: type VI secretion system membrane subunit TssM [Formivibrio sp.]|nr:type VI secretion system membrane subunit TssM [Formivibrio sp.]